MLRGHVALVTGAAAGIGRATACALAQAGARVAVADIDEAAAARTVSRIQGAGGDAIAVRADVTDPEAVDGMIAACLASYDRIDIAVNNAGVTARPADSACIDDDAWNVIFATNVTGLWRCMKRELEVMVGQGGGVIVNQASALALVGCPGAAAYVASKHAILGLSRSAALEYVGRGIRINAVCAGPVETDMLDTFLAGSAEAADDLRRATPIGRFARPEEVARAIVWLCSPAASYVIGHGLVVDGGWTAR